MLSFDRALVGSLALVAAACAPKATSTAVAPPAEGPRLATEIAAALVAACPVTVAADVAAREACAAKLAGILPLRDHMVEPFLWGAQRTVTSSIEDSTTTRFNPLVWRRMYLSLEMFTGRYRIETLGDRTLLRIGTRFRSELDPGEYPYPFWHSSAKWESYEFSREVVFVIEGDHVIGAMRSAEQDRSRPAVAHAFDGSWAWEGPNGEVKAPVVLYRSLFSRGNPHVAELDQAYRAFEAESRQYNCTSCHRPDNVAGQRQLEMICYPNQALASRHTIVRAIETRRMPPAAAGEPAGVADPAARERLLSLARRFEATAEAALASEAAAR